MFVLGVDPGLTTAGYGVVRAGHPPLPVAVGVIRTDAAAPIAQRLLELHHDLADIISEHKPAAVAIESMFTNLNLATANGVGRAAGVAILAAAEAGIPVFEYSPTAVKSAVTGDGRARKRQVQLMVARRLNLASPPSPPDAADALAVALCHLQTMRLGAAS
jgi:crossover junction endodeoxyribonuclease RuvC